MFVCMHACIAQVYCLLLPTEPYCIMLCYCGVPLCGFNFFVLVSCRIFLCATGDVKRDVVFLIDGSQYAAPEFRSVREFIERLVNNLNVGSDTTRVALIQFSEDPKVEFLLNAYSTKDEVQDALRDLRPKGGRQVNVGYALEYVAKNIFTRPSGSRIEEGAPQFLILLFSRPPDDDVEDPAYQVKQVGVAPLTIGKNVNPEEMVKIALSPEYVFQVSTYQDLPSLEQKLTLPITTLTTQQIQQIISDTSRPSGKRV